MNVNRVPVTDIDLYNEFDPDQFLEVDHPECKIEGEFERIAVQVMGNPEDHEDTAITKMSIVRDSSGNYFMMIQDPISELLGHGPGTLKAIDNKVIEDKLIALGVDVSA